jgi:peroxidase
MNAITHWLDASMVYGSNTHEAEEVRDEHRNRLHLLKVTTVEGHVRPLLPSCSAALDGGSEIEACTGGPCNNGTDRGCVYAGDLRTNEQPGLTSLHTLWFREHNRVAEKLRDINPHWSLEQLFQEAKKIVIATWQNVVFQEWVSIAVGPQFMRSLGLFPLQPGQGYTQDYDSSIDPRISAEFSGAAFRFGHSMVPSLLPLKAPRGRQSNLPLKNMFFRPWILNQDGAIDDILRGLNHNTSPDWDGEFSNDLTNHLFEETTNSGGLDLVSLNIQRGRDLGIHGYNRYRERCSSITTENYNKAKTFDDLTKGGFLTYSQVAKLKSIYDHVDDIDLFAGGTLEGDLREGLLGPAFACIVGDQFHRLKRGDKFWFENGDDPRGRFSAAFTEEQVDSLRGTSMARVMCDNTDIGRQQPMAFRTPSGSLNAETDCKNINHGVDLNLWKESK